MLKNAKAKGSRNEHKSINYLESDGYACVRAGGSLGRFDLVCWNRDSMKLIQVKTNHNASPKERAQIEQFDNIPPNATKEIWVWKDYAKVPIIKVL